MSTISIERSKFSTRLIGALASARGLSASPTVLAREFNQVFQGDAVTVHAARKWLLGDAIPTQDKLQALAGWLDVSVDWLRFGSEDDAGESAATPDLSARAANGKLDALVRQYMALPQRDREMARQFIAMLVKQHRADRDTARMALTEAAADKLSLP